MVIEADRFFWGEVIIKLGDLVIIEIDIEASGVIKELLGLVDWLKGKILNWIGW
jgi:hypothetical protein